MCETEGVKITLYVDIEKNSANSEANIIKIKNRLKETKEFLSQNGLSEIQSRQLIDPLETFLESIMLKEERNECLVMFLSANRLDIYSLPTDCEDVTYISNHFMTRGILQLFFQSDDFYLLILSETLIELYYCSRESIQNIKLPFAPQDFKDFLKFKDATTEVQFGSNSAPKTMGKKRTRYFGYGARKDAREPQLIDFLRAIDHEVERKIGESQSPLILATTSELFGDYEKISKIKNLAREYIEGNFDRQNIKSVHREALKLGEKIYKKKIDLEVDRYRFLKSKGLTSGDLKKIIDYSKLGKIETLFFQREKLIWGEDTANAIRIHLDKKTGDNELIELASYNTLLHNGVVLPLIETYLPDENAVSAVIRK